MRTPLYRAAAVSALLVWLAVLPAPAQPTPASTVITNMASAGWTDANSNTYIAATASASMTTGQVAGVDVTSPATITPASPSTANELAFTVTNTGNEQDAVSVSVTAAAGLTVTGYKLGSTTYAMLAELNSALAAAPITAGNSATVVVVYTVAPGRGGATMPLALTATSTSDSGTSDTSTTDVVPAVAAFVNVTPDGGTVSRLPSNGTQYTATFTIENAGNASDTYTLAAGLTDGAVAAIVSVNGTAGTAGSVTVTAGGSTTADVVYTVANVAAGASTTLSLTATSANDASVDDEGSRTIAVVRAALSLTKEVFEDDQTTPIGGGDEVVPGQFVWYRITVTNTGGGAAATVSVSDPLPAQVTYVSSTSDAAGWTISETSGTVTASLSGLLASAASRYFWIRVQVK